MWRRDGQLNTFVMLLMCAIVYSFLPCIQLCFTAECVSLSSFATLAGIQPCPIGPNGETCSDNGVGGAILLLCVSMQAFLGSAWL